MYFSDINIQGGEDHVSPAARNLGIDRGIAEVIASSDISVQFISPRILA